MSRLRVHYFIGLFAATSIFVCTATAAREWTYSTKTDTFDGVEVRSANLPGDRATWITISHDSKGRKLAMISSSSPFDCFPECNIRVKFDDAQPMNFTAIANKVQSRTVLIEDQSQFERLAASATKIVVRAPRFRSDNDMTFEADKGFTTGGWTAMQRRAARAEECQKQPTAVEFSACMDRP